MYILAFISYTRNLSVVWQQIEVRGIFVDISKDLGEVWHKSLIFKLKKI